MGFTLNGDFDHPEFSLDNADDVFLLKGRSILLMVLVRLLALPLVISVIISLTRRVVLVKILEYSGG